jgi:hypothetical protein
MAQRAAGAVLPDRSVGRDTVGRAVSVKTGSSVIVCSLSIVPRTTMTRVRATLSPFDRSAMICGARNANTALFVYVLAHAGKQ